MLEYVIYTDGSDLKHTTRRLGVGGVLLDQDWKELDRFGLEIDRLKILSDYNTTDCSNPFAEMIAVKEALLRFSKFIKPGSRITLKSDYRGVTEWMTGGWKTKAPYIKQVKEEILDIIRDRKLQVNFMWVKGHQSIMSRDSIYNNLVDGLAKGNKK